MTEREIKGLAGLDGYAHADDRGTERIGRNRRIAFGHPLEIERDVPGATRSRYELLHRGNGVDGGVRRWRRGRFGRGISRGGRNDVLRERVKLELDVQVAETFAIDLSHLHRFEIQRH